MQYFVYFVMTIFIPMFVYNSESNIKVESQNIYFIYVYINMYII